MEKNYVGIRCKDLDSHLTILFLGDQIPSVEALAILKPLTAPVGVKRGDFTMFGPNNDVPVIKVHLGEVGHPLYVARDALIASGLQDASGFEWTPHITLPKSTEREFRLPPVFTLEQPYICVNGVRYHA